MVAKKIRLDFSKVEERSGWNTKSMPEGLHEMKVELVDDKDANDGTAMWTYGLRPTNPKYKTRLFPYYCKHQQNQLFKIRDLFIAAGETVPKKVATLDPNKPIGKLVAAEIVDSSNPQYAGRSEIDGVYNTDILEDAGNDDASEDDEEYEGDEEDETEEVEDDEDDEEGEDDEELREEIEALTLGELRKRAKALDIDTEGVKKIDLIELVIEEELGGGEDEEDEEEDDLDDEDLDDEDLEDEEFEDEEDEEEEPVKPARRAAPARKPAAKASAKAAAPARRTVKRR